MYVLCKYKSFQCFVQHKKLIVYETLTNLEELSLRMVLAFPQDSRIGLVWTILSSRLAFFSSAGSGAPSFLTLSLQPRMAKQVMTFLVFSVLPAPDSPEPVLFKFSVQMYLIMDLVWGGRNFCEFRSNIRVKVIVVSYYMQEKGKINLLRSECLYEKIFFQENKS